MSRTLFWYVFKDLLKIFLMASGSLAGIMSFGGLLRPLTQNGLDGAQVLLLIRYSMPAMSTYSLPVAALFATTWVYGRMAADNEITACRASGISFIAMSTPAMLLGLLVSVMSLYLLCFIVPRDTLKIEQVIVSNLGKLIVNQIEQTHETHFGYFTIFAQEAHLLETDSANPNQQAVVLRGPMIVSFARAPDKDKWFNVAKDFYMARQAIAYIDEDPDEGSATLKVILSDGVKFPRRFSGPKAEQGGVGAAQFGPVDMPSRLGEKTKFMDIFQLKSLERNPERGRDVQRVTAEFIAEDQADAFERQLAASLNGVDGMWVFQAGDDVYSISRAEIAAKIKGGAVELSTSSSGNALIFRQESGGQVRLTAEARSALIDATADTEHDQLIVTLTLKNVLVDAGDTQTPKAELPRRFVLPMPPEISAMKARMTSDYLEPPANPVDQQPEAQRQKLWYEWVNLINHVSSELHARAAFVVSCLLLVLVGTSLGMMFKSGNFLTAFAVSVAPAMMSVVLIVTGQHTAENVPQMINASNNPLATGIAIIWAGNVVIGIAAVALLARLQRQ